MANYFHVALYGMTHSWFMSLPEGSIRSSANLNRQFISNFAGTYTCPGVENNLHNIIQHPDESL
jgi:hypothetical protein